MDTETQIANPVCPFPLADVRYEMFTDHVRNEDPFRVVNCGLYCQIAPPIHHLPEFVTWLANSYQKERNPFVSTSGVVILEITPLLIQRAMSLPESSAMYMFTNSALAGHFAEILDGEKQSLLGKILALEVKTLPSDIRFPLTLFRASIQLVLAAIACLMGEDTTLKINRAALGYLHKMK